MGAQDQQILPAGAVIHHSKDPHFQKVTDNLRSFRMESSDVRVQSHRVEHGQFQVLFRGEGDQFVASRRVRAMGRSQQTWAPASRAALTIS